MIVYLDSSFVIRRLLGVGEPAEFWGKWEKAYASTLMRTECFRAANLLRLEGKLDDAGRARLGGWIETVCSAVVHGRKMSCENSLRKTKKMNNSSAKKALLPMVSSKAF